MSRRELIRDIYPKPAPELCKLSIGDTLYTTQKPEELYIIAQVSYAMVCLVSLTDGNRVREAIKVDKVRAITMDEFTQMAGTYHDVNDWVRVGYYNEAVKYD